MMSQLYELTSNPETALIAVNAILQSTLILIVGWLVLQIIRPKSALLRRGFLMLILISLLWLPLVKYIFDANEISWTILPMNVEMVHEESRQDIPVGENSTSTIQEMKQAQAESFAEPKHQVDETKSAGHLVASRDNQARSSTSNVVIASNIFLAIWIVGTSLLLLRIAYGTLIYCGFRRGLTEIDDDRIQNVITNIPEKLLRGKKPTVCISGAVGFPFTVGIFRPVIVIPSKLYTTMSDDELLAIATHELAHLAQRDLTVGLLQSLLKALYWWNPLVYITNRSLSAAMEDVCDNYAIAALKDRTRYAECLTNIVEKTTPVCNLQGSVAMTQSPGSLERRVKTILWRRRDMGTETKILTKIALAALFVVITGLAAGSKIAVWAGNTNEGSVTFKTEKVAPEYFDAWSFFWKFPSCESKAKLGFVVLDPGGNEYYRKPTEKSRFRGWCRSDFMEGPSCGDPSIFFKEHISFKFNISEGVIMFPLNHGFYFTFYKKDDSGKINWQKPIKRIKAAVDEDEIKKTPSAHLSYGHTITFSTKKKAPSSFDGWTFYWEAPVTVRSANVDYVVLDPNGKECFSCNISDVPGGAAMRSSFSKEFAGGDHTVFFNKQIRLKARVSEGPLKFPIKHGFRFAFHKKGDDGKVDWRNSFATIDAKADIKELEKAGVIPPDIEISNLNTKGNRQISSSPRSPDLHWQSVRLFKQGEYDQCIANLEKVVAEQPKRNWSWYLLGRSQYEKGNYEGALKTFNHLVDLCQKLPYSRYHYEKGRTLIKLGRKEEAVTEFKKAMDNLDADRGYRSFVYSDETMEGKSARSKDEIIKLLKK